MRHATGVLAAGARVVPVGFGGVAASECRPRWISTGVYERLAEAGMGMGRCSRDCGGVAAGR